jgi:hypothetical protein
MKRFGSANRILATCFDAVKAFSAIGMYLVEE